MSAQVSVVAVTGSEKRERLAMLCADQDHIRQAPVFLAWSADLSMLERACRLRGYSLVNDYVENFLVSTMDATIVMLPGDGIGPEVAAEARKVLQAVAAAFGHSLTFTEALIGGIAIDHTGSALPDETVAACKAAGAVMLGAVGGPKWDDPNAAVRPEQGLLNIRKELGLYANLRPVSVHPALADATPLRP